MRFIVRVRPFPRPHDDADVLIHVEDEDDVTRLTCWFESERLETETYYLDDIPHVRDFGTADHLVYTVDELRDCVDVVLRNAIENGERILRHARRELPFGQQTSPAPTTTEHSSSGRSAASPMHAAAPSFSFASGPSAPHPRRVTHTPRQQGGDMPLAVPRGNNNLRGGLPSPHVATADLLSLETGADDSFAAAINDSFAASAWATAVHRLSLIHI